MNRKTFLIRLLSLGGLSSLLLPVLYSCAFDTGLDVDRPLPLGNFHAQTSAALSGYHHPKFAVLWQAMDGSVSTWDIGNATVDTSVHEDNATALIGAFSHLPIAAIANSDTYVIGRLWLYDDTSSNGNLQLTLPADYNSTLALAASAKSQLQLAKSNLAAAAQFTAVPGGVADSFRVRGGNLYEAGSTSTPISGYDASSGVTWDWRTLLKARFRVLFSPDKWEDFFNPTGGFSAQTFQVTASGSDTLVSSCQLARYQPRPGSTAAFEQALESATLIQARLDSLTNAAKNEINEIWQVGTSFPMNQRFLGRATQDYIVYFSSQASLRIMDTAEQASAFFFAGKEGLKVGFNLVECDTLGNCDVRDTSESVAIHLGDRTTPIFDFPKVQPGPFLSAMQADSQSADTVGDATGKYGGRYDCACDTNTKINVYYARGASAMSSYYYMEFADYGLLKFQPVDSETYSYQNTAQGLSIQIRFIDRDSVPSVAAGQPSYVYNYKLIETIQDPARYSGVQLSYFPNGSPLSQSEDARISQEIASLFKTGLRH